jgi:DNA polymerase I-like protein with 3'-5' exonuclease and polymerase domains
MTDWSLAIRTEHEIARIIAEQERVGWQFDTNLAHRNLEFLKAEQERIYNEVRPALSLEALSLGEIKKPFLKTGEFSAAVERYLDTLTGTGSRSLSDHLSGPFSRVDFVEPDIGSRQKLMKQLLRLGWKPLEYTEKGNPRLTEESLETLTDQVGTNLATWYIYQHRASLIESQLLPNVRADGRIPAEAIPIGTNTNRMTHKIVVNIPKASDGVIFGRECRQMFIARPGYVLVGYDAKGLELRMLAHLINDEGYTLVIVEGDPHALHQELAGLGSRDDAKTFIYAFIYGGGDAKLGSILGKGRDSGKRIRARFLSRIPNLEEVIADTQREAGSGFVTGLDGRRLWLRKGPDGELKTHTALNLKLQGNGAITMKTHTVFLNRLIKKAKLDAPKVGDFHDEGQHECREDQTEKLTELIHEAAVKTYKLLKLNVPFEMDVKVGMSWAETH